MSGVANYSKIFNLEGRTAIVTGGSRGIGLALAEGLAAHGADVAIVVKSTVDRAETAAQAIRAAGRWASDVYILYTRCNMHSAVQLASVIGSTSFEDTERGIRFADEELLLMPEEMPAIRFDEYLSTDMLEDLEDEA